MVCLNNLTETGDGLRDKIAGLFFTVRKIQKSRTLDLNNL